MRRKTAALIAFLFALFAAASAAEPVTVTLQFGGDVLIHEPLLQDALEAASGTYDFSPMLAPVRALLREADLTALNLETPVASGKYTGYPQFNSPPSLLDALAGAGVDLLLCANNHALDRLGKGARETIGNIESAGLSHIGTARDREEFNAAPLFDLYGVRVAIFNYTQHTNGMEKQDTEQNLRYAVHYFGLNRAERDIRAAREAGADFIVLCVHWGKEYERYPTDGVRAWAEELCRLGADLVIGGHPHVLQPAERLTYENNKTGETRSAFVVYSTGNFLTGQREPYRDSGALFRFTLEKDLETGKTALADYRYIPTWVWLDEQTGAYRVLDMREAVVSPPAGMSGAAYARLADAWEETVGHLGVDALLRREP